MKRRIAVAVEITGTDEIVAEHFGRCSKLIVCELDYFNKIIKTETYFNPLSGEHSGARQIPDYIKQFNVNTIIAGGMGQKAISKFIAYGIDVITAPGLAFDQALNLFIEGKLKGYETYKQSSEYHN